MNLRHGRSIRAPVCLGSCLFVNICLCLSRPLGSSLSDGREARRTLLETFSAMCHDALASPYGGTVSAFKITLSPHHRLVVLTPPVLESSRQRYHCAPARQIDVRQRDIYCHFFSGDLSKLLYCRVGHALMCTASFSSLEVQPKRPVSCNTVGFMFTGFFALPL